MKIKDWNGSDVKINSPEDLKNLLGGAAWNFTEEGINGLYGYLLEESKEMDGWSIETVADISHEWCETPYEEFAEDYAENLIEIDITDRHAVINRMMEFTTAILLDNGNVISLRF
jgi:hypothetical protein